MSHVFSAKFELSSANLQQLVAGPDGPVTANGSASTQDGRGPITLRRGRPSEQVLRPLLAQRVLLQPLAEASCIRPLKDRGTVAAVQDDEVAQLELIHQGDRLGGQQDLAWPTERAGLAAITVHGLAVFDLFDLNQRLMNIDI